MSTLIEQAEKIKSLLQNGSDTEWEQSAEAISIVSEMDVSGCPKEAQDLCASLREDLAASSSEGEPLPIEGDRIKSIRERLAHLADTVIRAEIDRIVDTLDKAERKLPVDAIHEVRQHRDLMIPRLIEGMEKAVELTRSGTVPEGQIHFFALFLLSELNAEEGFPAILEAFRLPGDAPHDLFGDALSEVFPRVLAQFAGDRLELLDSLLGNEELDLYVRWAAASSFYYIARDGRVSREEVIACLQPHLQRAMEIEDFEMVTAMVSTFHQLGPTEVFEDIRKAYELNLVETFLCSLKDIEKAVAQGEKHIARSYERCLPTGIEDTIDELSGWASFQEPPPRAPDPVPPRPVNLGSPVSQTQSRPSRPTLPPPMPLLNEKKVGRNAPCPCGSGKKFKKCCGR